jgi:acetyltransferase-like isoleucine patch superfamily enzyme
MTIPERILSPAPTAARYPEVSFGNNVWIGSNVSIGRSSVIGNNVVLHDDSVVGEGVRIDDGSVIGKHPLRSLLSAVTRVVPLPPATLGNGCLTVREQTVIGELSIIGRGVAIENQVHIGARCKIETGAYITAMSTIGDLCFIAPEVTFTNDNYVGRTEERFKHFGGVTMERGARVGANATVLPGILIGEDALVAAGSTVTRDVAPGMVVMGSPARVVRPVPSEQLLSPARPADRTL